MATKFTEAVAKKISVYVSLGASIADAAKSCGLSYETVNNWYKRGKEAKTGAYFDFYQSLERAKSECILVHLKNIHDAGKTDWKASAWILARLRPKQFSEQKGVQISNKIGVEGGDVATTVIVKYE